MRRCWGLWLVVLVVAGSLASATAALGDGITNSGDDLRTGWYPNAQITRADVTGGRSESCGRRRSMGRSTRSRW